jgi:VanZ family protein
MLFKSLSTLLARHDGRLKSFCRTGFAVCILIVCVLSLLPEDEVPDVAFSDKVHHLIAYAVIAALGMLGYRGPRAAVAVVIGSIALGGLLEIGQGYVPGRYPDMLDFVANAAGVAVGLILARLAASVWPSSTDTAQGNVGRVS